jgi:hypothetical protein
MTWRELNLCAGRGPDYRALMGRMPARVLGPLVVLAVGLAVPAVASAAPNGSVAGWRSPLAGTMHVAVQATPDPVTGAALRSATATMPGYAVSESFGDGTCSQVCPATVVLAVHTVDPHTKQINVTNGDHWLEVTIEDVTGAKKILRQMITVDNTPLVNRPTVTVQIGSGTIAPPSSPPGGGDPPGPGPTCRAPRLSMRLADKPLRFRRGVPVLKRGKAYRYEGKLTCRVDGRRRPAPRGMEVQVRNRLRAGWTVVKPSVEVRKAGEIVARLAYSSSRTIIFRVRGAGGEVVRVRIPIRVVRR